MVPSFTFACLAQIPVHRVKGQNKPAFPENRPAPAACRKRHARKPGEDKAAEQLPHGSPLTSAPSAAPQAHRGTSQPHQMQPWPHIGVFGVRAAPGRAPAACPGLSVRTHCQALPDGSCWQAGRGKPAIPCGTAQHHAQPHCQSQRRVAAVQRCPPLGEGIPCPLTCPQL